MLVKWFEFKGKHDILSVSSQKDEIIEKDKEVITCIRVFKTTYKSRPNGAASSKDNESVNKGFPVKYQGRWKAMLPCGHRENAVIMYSPRAAC